MEDQQQALIDAGRTESHAVGAVIAEFGITAELGDTGPGTGTSAPALLSIERAEEYVEAIRRSRWIPAVAIPPSPWAPRSCCGSSPRCQ